MHLDLDTLLDLYLLQDEFLRGGALWRGEGGQERVPFFFVLGRGDNVLFNHVVIFLSD